MPHNQATTNDGRDGAWASAEIQLSQRVEHTKERLRSMNIKLRKLESQFGVQIQQVLQGRFADKPWQMLQHFEQLKQTVSLDRHEYESIGRKASIRMDEREPAAYLMNADKFIGALSRALQRLGMYAKKKDDEAEYARQQVKMVKRSAAKDRARLDKASLLRKTTASRAVNRLRSQLTAQQRSNKTASAKSKAKISDLQNQVNDLQDVAMSAAPVVPTMEPTDAFETAGRFDGADIISLGGGHTMSRSENPTETFDNWARSFATSETDMSSFDSALGSVDNRTELARVNETPMGKMPPVHANPPVRKNTGKQQDAVEILNARANLQTQVTEGGGVNLDAITDRLQQLENRVSEVATGTTVTGNESTTLQANFSSASPNPNRDAPEHLNDRRAQAMSAQFNPITNRVKPPAKVNVVVPPRLPAVANFNASASNLGRRKKRKASGAVQDSPIDLPTADNDVTRAFDTQRGLGVKRAKPSGVDAEFEAALKLAVQKISQAARAQQTHDVRQEYERLAAMQPPGDEPNFREKRLEGIIQGSHEYIAYRHAMDQAEAIRRKANERQIEIDRHHAIAHRPEPSRPGKKKRGSAKEWASDIVDVKRGEIKRGGKAPSKKTYKARQGQDMIPGLKHMTQLRAPSAPPERQTAGGGPGT